MTTAKPASRKLNSKRRQGRTRLARLAPHVLHHRLGRVQRVRRQDVVDFSFVDDVDFARVKGVRKAEQRRQARETGKDEEPIRQHVVSRLTS